MQNKFTEYVMEDGNGADVEGFDESGKSKKDKGLASRTAITLLVKFDEYRPQIYIVVGIVFTFALFLMVSKKLNQQPAGICIFDMSSLMIKDNKASAYALKAQQKCLQLGHDIAVFSPYVIDPTYDYESKFLSVNFPDIWTESMLHSNAYQIKPGIDTAEALQAIGSFYDKKLSCSVLISSHFESERFSEAKGIAFSDVKEDGVTPENLETALAALQTACVTGKKSEEDRKIPCSDLPPDGVFTCSRQKKWGKCSEAWMSPFCCYTCHSCSKCSSGESSDFAVKKD